MRHRKGAKRNQQSLLARLLLLLVLGSSGSGCTLIDRTANTLNHLHDNRCSDLTGSCGAPVVTLNPPQGYLTEGATFAGAEITGPPGKTAVDRVIELAQEVEQLRRDNEALRERLELAQTTIDQQATTIDAASKELQLAMNDYALMRDGLAQWQIELRSFEDRYRENQDEQGRFVGRSGAAIASDDSSLRDDGDISVESA
jgi:hypothetical protein